MTFELAGAGAWIGERLAAGSLQGAVVVALAWLAVRCVPRVPAALQAWVWWLVALKLVLVLLPLPAVPLALLPASSNQTLTGAGGVLPAPTRIQSGDIRGAGQVESAAAPAASWTALVAAVWLVGVALHGLVLVRASLAARRLLRRATPVSEASLAAVSQTAATLGLLRVPRVRASSEVTAPQVVGVRDPVVLLPADCDGNLTSDERRMVLAHELMHVRRRDVLLGYLPAFAERLYFFHPLVRLAAREYVTAREAACDAAVVRVLDVKAHDYGRLLLRIGVAQSRPVVAACADSASASCLRRRLDMLQHIPPTTGSRLISACALAAAVLVLTPVQIVAQRPAALPALPPLPPLAAEQARPAPPAPPAPPAVPAPAARPQPAAAPQLPRQAPPPPAPPAPPAPAAVAPAAPAAAPLAPAPPLPPPPPSSDEVVLRLKSPGSEKEAVDTAIFVLQSQLAQVDDQIARSTRLTVGDREELAQVRRKLEELLQTVASQARTGQTGQQRSLRLSQQMAELNREREALAQQQREVNRQLERLNQEFERMQLELRSAEEAAKKINGR